MYTRSRDSITTGGDARMQSSKTILLLHLLGKVDGDVLPAFERKGEPDVDALGIGGAVCIDDRTKGGPGQETASCG